MLALPLRHGGLSISNPVNTAEKEYEASISVTQSLKNLIRDQQMNLDELDYKDIENKKTSLRLSKEARYRAEYKVIMDKLPTLNAIALEQAALKGASSWLVSDSRIDL